MISLPYLTACEDPEIKGVRIVWAVDSICAFCGEDIVNVFSCFPTGDDLMSIFFEPCGCCSDGGAIDQNGPPSKVIKGPWGAKKKILISRKTKTKTKTKENRNGKANSPRGEKR